MLHTIYQSETMREVRTIVGWVRSDNRWFPRYTPGPNDKRLFLGFVAVCIVAALRNL